jgi:hypothetical protein
MFLRYRRSKATNMLAGYFLHCERSARCLDSSFVQRRSRCRWDCDVYAFKQGYGCYCGSGTAQLFIKYSEICSKVAISSLGQSLLHLGGKSPSDNQQWTPNLEIRGSRNLDPIRNRHRLIRHQVTTLTNTMTPFPKNKGVAVGTTRKSARTTASVLRCLKVLIRPC